MKMARIKSYLEKIFENKLGIIRASILLLGLFAVSVIWPMGKFTTEYKSTGTWDGIRFIGPGTEENVIRQEFSPNFDNLTSVSVYIVNEPDSFDTLETFFRVYSLDGTVLAESKVNLADYEVPGFVKFPLNVSLEPGIVYFYTVGGTDGEVFVALTSEEAGNAEAGAFYYNNVHSGGTNVVAEFDYIRPWGIKRIVFADLLVVAITFLLYSLISIFLGNMESEKAYRIEKVFKIILTGLLATAAVGSIVGIVVFEPFEHDTLNNVVLSFSTACVASLLIYGIWTAQYSTEFADYKENFAKFTRLISTLLLTGAILMCCMYLNSGSDYEHGLWIRRMLVFFALFLYSLGKVKQIWNVPALIWSIASVVIGKIYISAHSDHIEHITTASSTAWLFWASGLIIIGLVYRVLNKDYKKLSGIKLSVAIPAATFWVLSCIFANGREWPLQMLITFIVAYLYFFTSDKWDYMLEMVCNSWLLCFFAGLVFCLYRRPYQYYRMTRYGGIFLTVTVTATFYLIPLAAALAKTLIAYRNGNRRQIFASFVVLGIISAYMLFTASRTGIIAYAFEGLFALIIFVWQRKKGNIKANPIRPVAGILGSIIISFFTCFGVTRMVPAMTANPFYFGHESFCSFLSSETPWDGGDGPEERFANIQLSINMLFGRLFSLEDDNDIFSKSAEILGIPSMSVVKAEDGSFVEHYSNNRIDIFRTYINNLDFKGHEYMYCEDENGEVIIHAHNSYIQVAYDFGIVMGVLFIILCIYCFFISIVKTSLLTGTKPYTPMLLILIVGFGVAGMFEWIYHPMNPLGFAFILSIVLLSKKEETENA